MATGVECLTRYTKLGADKGLPVSELVGNFAPPKCDSRMVQASRLQSYCEKGAPSELDMALEMYKGHQEISQGSQRSTDSPASPGGSGELSSATEASLKLLRLYERQVALSSRGAGLTSSLQGLETRDLSECLLRFSDVASSLSTEVALQLLVMSDGNDIVAMEHMFSPGGAFGEPSGRASDLDAEAASGSPVSYEDRHKRAVEKLEMQVRMEEAKRRHEAQQKLIEEKVLAAEQRRGAVERECLRILEAPHLWAHKVMENYKKRATHTPMDVRRFMDRVIEELYNKHGTQLAAVASGPDSGGQMTEEDQQMLGQVIEEILQRLIELPLQNYLLEYCRRQCAGEDQELARRQAILRHCSQESEHFGLPKHAVSPSKWKKACMLLGSLEEAVHTTPNQRIQILLSVKRAIELTYEAESRERGVDPTKRPLSADEIMPIFTFVVANTQTRSLKAIQTYLYELTAQGMGEAAYYLCVLEASVGHVLSIDIQAEEEAYHRRHREELERRRAEEQLRLEESRRQARQAEESQAPQGLQAECPKCGTTLWVKALVINVCGACEHKFYVKKPR